MKTEFKAVKKPLNYQSQLRQDLTSGEWILFAPKRGIRPDQFKIRERIEKTPKAQCIFEDPIKAGGGKLIASYPNNTKWRLQVVPNKYPVVTPKKEKASFKKTGAHSYIEGYGHHELVITKDHDANFPKLSIADANMLFNVFRERYREIEKDKNTAYVSIFHNWGPKAGASIYHPHYQILSTPIIPPQAERSLNNAKRFNREHKKCAHCLQIDSARRQKLVINENELAIAFMPYAPREPFEFRVSPKSHTSHFEDASEYEIHYVVSSLQSALAKLEKKIPGVNYNLYIHNAPAKDKKDYSFYHWHVQVVPREITPHLGITGGFELTTNMEINSVFPETAVKILNSR